MRYKIVQKAADYVDPAFKDQIMGVLRILVPAALSYAAARGWMTTEALGALTSTVIDILAGVITLLAIIWSFMKNREASQISRVARMKAVRKVVAAPEIADVKLKGDPKVVST